MSEVDFVNLYIDRIINEVIELEKVKLLNEARIAFMEKVNADLVVERDELLQWVEKAKQAKVPETPSNDYNDDWEDLTVKIVEAEKIVKSKRTK
jgi:nitrogenase subunit NifH